MAAFNLSYIYTHTHTLKAKQMCSDAVFMLIFYLQNSFIFCDILPELCLRTHTHLHTHLLITTAHKYFCLCISQRLHTHTHTQFICLQLVLKLPPAKFEFVVQRWLVKEPLIGDTP